MSLPFLPQCIPSTRTSVDIMPPGRLWSRPYVEMACMFSLRRGRFGSTVAVNGGTDHVKQHSVSPSSSIGLRVHVYGCRLYCRSWEMWDRACNLIVFIKMASISRWCVGAYTQIMILWLIFNAKGIWVYSEVVFKPSSYSAHWRFNLIQMELNYRLPFDGCRNNVRLFRLDISGCCSGEMCCVLWWGYWSICVFCVYKKPSPNPDIALKSEPAYLFRRNGYLTNYRCTRLKFDVSAENKFLWQQLLPRLGTKLA